MQIRKMAGEPGFEPGLTESESVVLPLDDSPVSGTPNDVTGMYPIPELSFGVLRSLSCLVQTDFFAFDLACIASQKASLTQRGAIAFVVI